MLWNTLGIEIGRSKMKRWLVRAVAVVSLVGFRTGAQAQIVVPGADGSDGPLNCGTLQSPPLAGYPCGVPCTSSTPVTYTIDLSAAANRDWNIPSPVPGKGVYDYQKWAVVFKYTCVDIPSYVTIKFKNHPSRAPVVWLVSGTVNIAGTVNLDGAWNAGTGGAIPEPGPGGFRGGGAYNTAGFGPGGGWFWRDGSDCETPGSYGGQGYTSRGDCGLPPTYGNNRIIPLIGGSGGSQDWGNGGGGAGGGAILIASTSTITYSGTIRAWGGDGASNFDASGGAIRLVANAVADVGSGNLQAIGGGGSGGEYGGKGRIRIEANTINLVRITNPGYTLDSVGSTATLWPTDVGNAPSVRIVSVSGQIAPTDPRASLDFPGADVTVPDDGAQLVVIDALYVPMDWTVRVRAVPKGRTDSPAVYAAPISGDETHSTWQATLPLLSGFTVLQVRAEKPAAAASASEAEEGVDTETSGVEEK